MQNPEAMVPTFEQIYQANLKGFREAFGHEPSPQFDDVMRQLAHADRSARLVLARQAVSAQATLDEERELRDRRITHICEVLHMANTGAGDSITPERRAEIRAGLQERLDRWSATPVAEWAAYDEAIRSLIVATLAEKSWDEQ